MYKLSSETVGSGNEKSFPEAIKRWIYVGYKRAHTHDVRSLTVAVPICHEGIFVIWILIILISLHNMIDVLSFTNTSFIGYLFSNYILVKFDQTNLLSFRQQIYHPMKR